MFRGVAIALNVALRLIVLLIVVDCFGFALFGGFWVVFLLVLLLIGLTAHLRFGLYIV